MADITEIDSKSVRDVQFRPNQVEVNSRMDAYLQQIRNIMLGSVGTTFGATTMPADLDKYLFQLGINTFELKQLIETKIKNYASYAKFFRTEVRIVRNTDGNVVINTVVDGRTRLAFKVTRG